MQLDRHAMLFIETKSWHEMLLGSYYRNGPFHTSEGATDEILILVVYFHKWHNVSKLAPSLTVSGYSKGRRPTRDRTG